MMPWNVLFFTVVSQLRKRVKTGSILKSKGMLTGEWIAEERMGTKEGYAIIRVRHDERRMIALVAVPHGFINMEEPSGDTGAFCRALTTDGDMDPEMVIGNIGQGSEATISTSQYSSNNTGASLVWGAVESPLTYAPLAF
jgi:hypothetical protein